MFGNEATTSVTKVFHHFTHLEKPYQFLKGPVQTSALPTFLLKPTGQFPLLSQYFISKFLDYRLTR